MGKDALPFMRYQFPNNRVGNRIDWNSLGNFSVFRRDERRGEPNVNGWITAVEDKVIKFIETILAETYTDFSRDGLVQSPDKIDFALRKILNLRSDGLTANGLKHLSVRAGDLNPEIKVDILGSIRRSLKKVWHLEDDDSLETVVKRIYAFMQEISEQRKALQKAAKPFLKDLSKVKGL